MSFNLTPSEARKLLMDLVAQRDHSEKELRRKLSLRCDPELTDSTLAWAKEQNWLAAPEKLQSDLAESLGRKGKGIHKINQKLKELGLPSVKSNPEDELAKARKLARAKWTAEEFEGLPFLEKQKLQAKIMRFLTARGFDSSVVTQVLKNEFKKSGDSYDEEF
jgi:regulatory protein